MNYGIGNPKGADKSKALFTTTTAPTESGDVITLATSDIVESGFKVGDYLAYVDSGNISALYSISAISNGTATLSLVGNVGGGGKQLYQHNIYLYVGMSKVSTTIINDSPTLFTTRSQIQQYLLDNGFNDNTHIFNASGTATNNVLTVIGLFANTSFLIALYYNGSTEALSNPTVVDTVIPL